MAYQNNATQMVYDLICDKIKSREWMPNDKIWTEQELSQALNVSRVAVRQAVDRLVENSVLKRVQGSGTYVEHYDPIQLIAIPMCALSSEDLLHIIRFRSSFDSGNVLFFIENATEEDFQALKNSYANMKQYKDNPGRFAFYDFEFHRIIAEGTKNPFIIKINNILRDILLNHQQQLNNAIGSQIGLEYHALILKYICDRDGELASVLMKKHLTVTAAEIERYLKKNID